MTAAMHRTPCLETARGEDAAQRPGELHPGRQLHPRRGARAALVLRRRRLQFRRHRQLGRRRAPDRRMDRRRRAAGRPFRRRHPPLRRLHREPPLPLPSAPARRSACTTRCAGRARSSRARAAAAHQPAARPPGGGGRGVRQQGRLGTGELFPAAGSGSPHALPAHARQAGLAGARDRRSSGRRARRSPSTTRRSFAKLLLQGRDALAVLQRVCANEIDVSVGRMVYTPMLNERGGFESDLTVTRLGVDRFLVVTGSAQATRDADWIARHTRAGRDGDRSPTSAR